MDVGVRELKAKLSEYLAAAAAGEDVVVTDRGRPVARLVPFGSTSAVDRDITFDIRQARTARAMGLSVIGS
jgi:prevent-host-death family protein